MNILRSIKGRLNGILQDRNSRYWEYAEFYHDGELWEDTILFESFGGSNFQGNPYYIYKEALKSDKCRDMKLVIAHRNPPELTAWLTERHLIDSRVEIIQTGSYAYRNTLAHAKYLVNNVSFNMDYIKKPGQVYLNTWHGTPLKSLGRKIGYDPFECNNAQRNFLLCDYLIAPNAFTQRVYLEDYMAGGVMPGKVVLAGYPRNSVFFDENARKQVRATYQMEGVKTVFFMPTWRGVSGGVEDVDQVSQIEQLAKDLGESYRVYVKFHPAMKKQDGDFRYCHNMPKNIEVYEFLNAMDILITDYSSVFFDFASAVKQIVLYQYDKEEYYSTRGVYPEAAEGLPFPVAYTYEELLQAVRLEKQPDRTAFLERYCKYDHLQAARENLQMLLNDAQREEKMPTDLYVIDWPITETELLSLQKNLAEKNYRFVFTLKRKARGFSNIKFWDKLSYMTLYMYDRLTAKEKLHYGLCAFTYACLRSKKAYEKMCSYSLREQRRLWGEANIGNIYAKSKNLPVAVKPFAKPWPKNWNNKENYL